MSFVDVPAGAGRVPAFVATPQTPGPWPAAVVVHDALGMTPDVQDHATWLAAHGYLAAAPDLFYWGGHLRCLVGTMSELARGRGGRSFQAISAVRDWLSSRPDTTGAVGIVGFCLGGGFALAVAAGGGFAAAAPNYGAFPAGAWTPASKPCPIVASYGAADPTLRGEAERLRSELVQLDVPHDVREYAGVGHGFMNRHEPAETPRLFRALMRLSHTRYDASATADARGRIVAFFDQHLRP